MALPGGLGGLEEGWDLRAELWGCPFPTGLSPDLQSMEQIRRIMRPTDVPDQGLLCDLLWSDPDKDVQGWGENDRGVSFTFGAEVVAKFLHKHDLDLICRAHQVPRYWGQLGLSLQGVPGGSTPSISPSRAVCALQESVGWNAGGVCPGIWVFLAQHLGVCSDVKVFSPGG